MPGFSPPLLGPLLANLAQQERTQQQMQPAPAPAMPGMSMEIGQSGSGGMKMKKTITPGEPQQPAAPPQNSLFQQVLLGLLTRK